MPTGSVLLLARRPVLGHAGPHHAFSLLRLRLRLRNQGNLRGVLCVYGVMISKGVQ